MSSSSDMKHNVRWMLRCKYTEYSHPKQCMIVHKTGWTDINDVDMNMSYVCATCMI